MYILKCLDTILKLITNTMEVVTFKYYLAMIFINKL